MLPINHEAASHGQPSTPESVKRHSSEKSVVSIQDFISERVGYTMKSGDDDDDDGWTG